MKGFSEFINEKRSNPEKNVRVSAYDTLVQYRDDKDAYISFTEIDKLGIKPSGTFDYPVGIYTYPLKEIFNNKSYQIDKNKSFKGLPSFSTRPIIWLIKPKSNKKLLRVELYDEKDLNSDIEILIDLYDKDTVNNIVNGFQEYSESDYDLEPFRILWDTTRLLSKGMSGKWNILFQQLGYSGLLDKTGLGLIDKKERMQCVFFNKTDITIIDKILNKDYK